MTSNVGLIVEGGGMRGAYTAGVLECFLDNHIEFPYAVGVSAGANTLCSYLSKQRLRNKRLYTEWVTDKRFIHWQNFFTKGTYFGMDFLFNELPLELDPFDLKAIHQNPTCFQVGVTNCLTGEVEYMLPQSAPTLEAFNRILKASSSLPFIAKVVEINGKPYLDGGIGDSIPIRQAQKEGYHYNVVILTRNTDYRKSYSKKLHGLSALYFKKYPKLVEAIDKRASMYNQTLDYLSQLEKEHKVFIIRPTLPLEVDRYEKDKEKLTTLYHQGYQEALTLLPQLRQWMYDHV